MATAIPQSIERNDAGGWVGSPTWDAFWMFSAIWGSLLLLATSLAVGFDEAGPILFAGNLALAVCHSWSTTYVVLGSPLLREARRGNRVKFTWIPLGIVAVSLLSGLLVMRPGAFPASGGIAPANWPWVVYISLFWVGHFWHFGNQDFGVLSIYRLKAGQTGLRDRKLDKAYAVAMMFVLQPIVYFKAVSMSPFAQTFFGIVPGTLGAMTLLAEIAVIVAIALSAGVITLELRKPNTSVQKLLYYGVMLTHPVVLFLVQWKFGFLYMITYFWSHWFIAIGLTGRVNTGYYRQRDYSPRQAFARHALPLLVITAAVWLFDAMVGHMNVFSGSDFRQRIGAVSPEFATTVGLILGLFLAEQLLHYYSDRCLFRMRDASVRKVVAPLL